MTAADGFYEFTEPKVQGKKTKWLFTMAGQPWFWIAVSRPPKSGSIPA